MIEGMSTPEREKPKNEGCWVLQWRVARGRDHTQGEQGGDRRESIGVGSCQQLAEKGED